MVRGSCPAVKSRRIIALFPSLDKWDSKRYKALNGNYFLKEVYGVGLA